MGKAGTIIYSTTANTQKIKFSEVVMDSDDKIVNILIADDMNSWLDYHKKNLDYILADKKYVLHCFESAHSAYDFAFGFNDRIDIVITDLEMESMEIPAGQWLIERLKETKSTELANYIIISASSFIKFVAQECGDVDYITKVSYYNNPLMLKYKLEEMSILK